LGLVQMLPNIWFLDWLVAWSAARPSNVAVDELLHDEKQRFSKIVAKAVGSRGSRLSVLEMAWRSFFMVAAEELRLARHTPRGLKSLLSNVAILSITDGNNERWLEE
jgi:hypothetical protein